MTDLIAPAAAAYAEAHTTPPAGLLAESRPTRRSTPTFRR